MGSLTLGKKQKSTERGKKESGGPIPHLTNEGTHNQTPQKKKKAIR